MRLRQILPSLTVLFLTGFESIAEARSLRDRRAVSYIANQTACVVDQVIYRDGDPIPTDDPCESCKCRPPGFSCVLRECEIKPGCKAIRREGECCPEYQCGCEHNGKFFNDGDRIPNAESPCYSCYCQGSSITCALADCQFRFDCEPEYVPGECCPRYDHCPPDPSRSTTKTYLTTLLSTTTLLPSSSVTSPTPIFISSPATTTPNPPSSSSASDIRGPDEIADVTTMTSMPSKNDPSLPGPAAEAEKQSSGGSGSLAKLPSAPDVTEPSSASLNQTSSAEQVKLPAASQVPVLSVTSGPSPPQAAAAAREPGVDEVSITISPNLENPKPVNAPENSFVATTSSIDISQDEYMTTKVWLPDHALPAEHRQQHASSRRPPLVQTNHSSNHPNATLGPESPTPAPSGPAVDAKTAQAATTHNLTHNGNNLKRPLDSGDEIRISDPAPESASPDPQPVTTVENNFLVS